MFGLSKAGRDVGAPPFWIPAFAGMTVGLVAYNCLE